jgi:hypothetical protein
LAYPFGGSEIEPKYFFLEMHYDNPDLIKNRNDYSGIKLYLTTNLRPIEFGILTVGAVPEYTSIILPPKVNSYQSKIYNFFFSLKLLYYILI